MTTWQDRMTPRPPEEPRLELVVPCWRMRGPSGHVLSCAIYRTDAGLEVRVGYAQDLLRSQRVVDVQEGHSRRRAIPPSGVRERRLRGAAGRWQRHGLWAV